MEQIFYSKEETVEWLMNEYGKMIVRLAFTYLKQEQLAEDVAQEVFIKCYQKLDTFRNESSYKTWLYSITVNLCKDRLRSWSFRNIVINNYLSNSSISKKTPESDLMDIESRRELSQLVLELPVKYREVIIFFYYEELTYQQITQLLGISDQTLKSRLYRGRNLLRKKLEGGRSND
ncbi:sigma-70 family RNA polymerase sigma factor [Bacillus sp. FJAT-49732]|uniref:Sigma-70 family RNA polymerase sigma factor n=1 Tax=Lederbergia citrisecunda TaxID=2833583 RepID=A0A942TMZ1_9BACI|nr:sigma-70 family RNA polymerase sigma factor [Lederbergia citrisecunda]MBS4199164.1 sigma-70 family RNA polymerase sigma factor [Lederbergia citrisecunda]